MRAGDHPFDPYIAILAASASSWPRPTTRPCWARTRWCQSWCRPTASTSSRCREIYGGNGSPPTVCMSAPSPAAGSPAGRRQIRRGDRADIPGRPSRAVQAEGQAAGRPRREVRRRDAGRGGVAPSAIPFRLAEFGNAIETDGNTTMRRPPRSSCPTRSMASSANRGRSITSASRGRKDRPTTFTVTPAGSARRSTR